MYTHTRINEHFLDSIVELVMVLQLSRYIHTRTYTHTQVNEAFLDSISELVMVLQRSSDTYVDIPCAELVRGPIKKPDRAIQKIVRLYNRDPASLTDLVRCTVVVAGLREAAAFLALIEQRSVVGLANVVVEGFDRCRFVHEYDGDTQKTMRITKLENRSVFSPSYFLKSMRIALGSCPLDASADVPPP
jgi:hypothetical protein